MGTILSIIVHYLILGTVSHNLVLTPENVGKTQLSFYIMSDCYMGLDQQYTIPLDVEEAGEEIFYSDEEWCD